MRSLLSRDLRNPLRLPNVRRRSWRREVLRVDAKSSSGSPVKNLNHSPPQIWGGTWAHARERLRLQWCEQNGPHVSTSPAPRRAAVAAARPGTGVRRVIGAGAAHRIIATTFNLFGLPRRNRGAKFLLGRWGSRRGQIGRHDGETQNKFSGSGNACFGGHGARGRQTRLSDGGAVVFPPSTLQKRRDIAESFIWRCDVFR